MNAETDDAVDAHQRGHSWLELKDTEIGALIATDTPLARLVGEIPFLERGRVRVTAFEDRLKRCAVVLERLIRDDGVP